MKTIAEKIAEDIIQFEINVKSSYTVEEIDEMENIVPFIFTAAALPLHEKIEELKDENEKLHAQNERLVKMLNPTDPTYIDELEFVIIQLRDACKVMFDSINDRQNFDAAQDYCLDVINRHSKLLSQIKLNADLKILDEVKMN